MKSRRFTLLHGAALISLLLFITALCLNAFTFRRDAQQETTSGIGAFFSGLLAPLGGAVFEWLVWLANPLLFVSIWMGLLGKRPVFAWLAFVFAWVAVILSGSFLFWKEIMVNEGGGTRPFQREAGYYCWLAAMLVWALGRTLFAVLSGRKSIVPS